MLDGQRIALKRFDPQMRSATAELLPIGVPIPTPWLFGGLGTLGVVLLVWGIREEAFVLVAARPLRAATAMGAAVSLCVIVPSIALAGGGGGGGSGATGPGYYWEMSDPLGTGMVLVDEDGSIQRKSDPGRRSCPEWLRVDSALEISGFEPGLLRSPGEHLRPDLLYSAAKTRDALVGRQGEGLTPRPTSRM
jgi:hypothetical protein